MPLFLLAGVGSIFAWETLAKGDERSPLSFSNVLKIAVVAGAVYLVAKAVR